MNKRILLLPLLLLCLPSPAKVDSTALAKLDSMLLGYVSAIRTESMEAKEKECDFLIRSSEIPEIRQRIAVTLFEYYKEADVMGDEAIAVNIYDKWFADGKIGFRGEFEQMQAELFANFNRHSLIGMQAPRILLRKPGGGKAAIPQQGRAAILYFYDTACGKCKLESKLLPEVLGKVDFDTDLCMVYSGQDRKAWNSFMKEFRCRNGHIRVRHFWDPEVESDFLRMYAVISTPRLYFVEAGGSIMGRRLEPDSLLEVIKVYSLYLSEYVKENTEKNQGRAAGFSGKGARGSQKGQEENHTLQLKGAGGNR